MVEMIAEERIVVKDIVTPKNVKTPSQGPLEETEVDVKFNAKNLGKKQTFKK